MKTFSAKPGPVDQHWFVVDASGKTLGRMASASAARLRGKHKPEYTPHVDTGDYIVVVNAAKVHVTGNKVQDKIYHHHTGFPGGIKSISFGKLIDGLAGEIPFTETFPELWVIQNEDYDQARRILEEGLVLLPSNQDTWTCAGCGERHQSQFGTCWKCGREKPPA